MEAFIKPYMHGFCLLSKEDQRHVVSSFSNLQFLEINVI